MGFQKEREVFETWLYSTEKFKCRNKIFLFMLDENGCYEDNHVLEHWETWQAAKAQAVPEQVLDAPACVGGGTFQKGVKWSTVIAAAQRHFKYTQNAKKAPSLDIDQVKKLVSGDFVLVEKQQLAQLMENMDSLGKKALGDNYVSFADIAVVLGEAQEQRG